MNRAARLWPKFFFSLGLLVLASTAVEAQDFRYAPKIQGIKGKDTVLARCVVCHSIEKNGPPRHAPNLYRIVGDKKARNIGYFTYSKALRKKGGIWSAKELDAYLKDPQGYIPGTFMSVAVTDNAERAAIIEYLAKNR